MHAASAAQYAGHAYLKTSAPAPILQAITIHAIPLRVAPKAFFPMQIAFLSNNPLNSVVVDAGTGERLYNICTPYGVGKRKTTIHDAWGRTVAKYKRRWGRDQIELYGMTRSVSSWLPSDSLFTR